MQIYIGIYAFDSLGLPWWEVGLVIATYQAARALANLLIPYVGIVVYHIIGAFQNIAIYHWREALCGAPACLRWQT